MFKPLLILLHLLALPDPPKDPGIAYQVILSAYAHKTSQVPAELLIAIAYHESRLDPHIQTGKACGVMQVVPEYMHLSRRNCVLWQTDIDYSVFVGEQEIEVLLQDPRVNNNLHRALNYRACGNSLFNNTCTKTGYAKYILRKASEIRN